MVSKKEIVTISNDDSIRKSVESLYQHIIHYVDQARNNVKRSNSWLWSINSPFQAQIFANLEVSQFPRQCRGIHML